MNSVPEEVVYIGSVSYPKAHGVQSGLVIFGSARFQITRRCFHRGNLAFQFGNLVMQKRCFHLRCVLSSRILQLFRSRTSRSRAPALARQSLHRCRWSVAVEVWHAKNPLFSPTINAGIVIQRVEARNLQNFGQIYQVLFFLDARGYPPGYAAPRHHGGDSRPIEASRIQAHPGCRPGKPESN